MNTAEYVANLIADQKAAGTDLQTVSWNAALACVGWPYIFGDRGELCTPAHRRAKASDAHPTIKSACKNFNGDASGCTGCKWFPGGKRVRAFDCRGFTYWILLQVYGWKLMGTGATSQWNDADNWTDKGEISTMPKDTLCCLFVQKGKTMEHTGFGLNNETIECSAGVQHFTSRKAKWTHWGVPKCISGSVTPTPAPTPEPTPTPTPGKHPTLRRGDKVADVVELQTDLVKLGYGIGPCGIDGDYGAATQAAVRQFQYDHKLTIDGICGPKTWAAIDQAIADLDRDPSTVTYSVIIRGLDKTQAEAIVKAYPNAEIIEGGAGA